MLTRIILTALFTLISGMQAWACSCYQNQSMSQIVENGVIAILTSPVGTEVKTEWSNKVYPTRLKIWKTFAGKSSEYESVSTTPKSSCALAIPANQTSLIIAWRNDAGALSTSICSDGGFDKDQWLKFFRTGEESPPRERCYQKIKRAYDAVVFLGKFKLDDPKCKVHISDYDTRFRVKR